MESNCRVFFFNTDFSGKFAKALLVNGNIQIDDGDSKYEFVADGIKPINMVTKKFFRTSVTPTYFIKWDELIPVNFEVDEIIEHKNLEEMKNFMNVERKETQKDRYSYKKRTIVAKPFEFMFSGKTKIQTKTILPEMLRSTVDLRFLKAMKAQTTESKSLFKNKKLVIALLISGLAIFIVILVLFQYGYMKV